MSESTALSEKEAEQLDAYYKELLSGDTGAAIREYEELTKDMAAVRDFKKSNYGKGGTFSATGVAATATGISAAATGISISLTGATFSTTLAELTMNLAQASNAASANKGNVNAGSAALKGGALVPLANICSIVKWLASGRKTEKNLIKYLKSQSVNT